MMNKRIISILLALLMAMSCVTAIAENARHERVYAVVGADGTVQSLTDSIRLENPEGLDVLSDSTLLTGIENVGGDETFALDGQTLTWQAKGKDITYQGTSDKPLPVTPEISATLDGQEVPVSQLKDKAGEALEKAELDKKAKAILDKTDLDEKLMAKQAEHAKEIEEKYNK